MANETVTLARYAAGLRYEDLPATVVAKAKDIVADTVAACICGADMKWSRIVIDYAERTGPGGNSKILGRGTSVQAPAAALANGALAHAFELDSLTRPGAGAHRTNQAALPVAGDAKIPRIKADARGARRDARRSRAVGRARGHLSCHRHRSGKDAVSE